MLVVTTNGKVVTGWRAWLFLIVAFAIAMFVFWLVAFLLFGLAISVGTIMLIAFAASAVVGLFRWLFGGRL